MLPLGVNPVRQIEQEKNPATQVIQLVSLLEYLLGFVSPGLLGKDGKPASVGELVSANRNLFTNPSDVFFGIGVRNNLVHAKATDATEDEIRRAIGYLFKAVTDLQSHASIPANSRQEVLAVTPEQAPTVDLQEPTKPVTTSPLPPAPPTPAFRQINQTTLVSATPVQPTTPVTAMTTGTTSYTTKVSPKPTAPEQTNMTAEPSISTRQIRNAAIVIAVLALAVFLAKPVWQFSKEKFYGSEANTQVTRTQAEAALKRIQTFDKRQGFAAKVTEAQAAWRDAEIAFKQEKFKDAEVGYRHVLQVWDELAVKENERKEVQQFFDEMNKTREAARVAQAPQYAAAQWQEAENTRRTADAAFKTGDLTAAKSTALQAQQKFEEAKSAADAVPKPSPTPAQTAEPTPSGELQRPRP
ncbi:MAG TPA: hypothetical protein PLD20_14960 [Blastocatellia bacterium]|nr:hypothetical protein [Blastocatellia bacterium]HMV82149.1 hypothetical protein [Blastocatellia bacterium]HMX24970.1 hypothetical protein [Blastocatellia bacterium]HMZ19233.1 hypothetical protein [Blastocatellia bacterium]HNG29062.1 hypothetical protein [Blastocatellia bacterium]